jgi:LCP family protein required for cell wall assembly
VSRAQAEAGTARVAARSGEAARDIAPARGRVRRSDGSPDPEPARASDGGARLRADRIDETLARLTAAHAGLDLARDDPDEPEDLDAGPEADTERAPAHPAVRAGRVVTAAVALMVVLVAGLGWVDRSRLDGALDRVAAVDVPPDGVLDPTAQAGDENVLLLATDSSGSAGATTRANTVVVVHVDARARRPVAVTLPPDLEITRPPCQRWDAASATYLDQTVPAEPRTTFDSAYAVGGPRCATRAAQQVTGLAITRFAAVDLAATSALVEAVGGVEVCVERPVLDAVVGPVLPAAGMGSLNGARAGALVRAADVRDDPPGGVGLVQRQQRVLAAALERALSPGTLLHPGRVGRLLPALGATVVSEGTGVDDLRAVSGVLASQDELHPAPTEPQANSRGNQVLRIAEANALFAAVRTDGPLPAPGPVAQRSGPTPADVTTDVLNASGRDGLAAGVAGTLGELGFRTGEVTNAPQPAMDTVVRFSPDRADQARLLAATVPSATAVPDPGTSGVLQLVLGRSFDGTVRASTEPTDEQAGTTPATPAATCR